MKFILLLLAFVSFAAQADILYFTDLEGSRARLEVFYRESGGFTLGADGHYHLKPGITLVYGGDATDRFPGSMWVVEEIVRLHDENPFTMYSIAGNRDISKMRFTNELSDAALLHPPMLFAYSKPEAYMQEIKTPTHRARRMKYMLANNMGAPEGFELWRAEIAERNGLAPNRVSDQRVVDSYLDFLKPDGAYSRMLEYMRLGVRIGNTLFVHGGVTPENLKFDEPIDLWLRHLNSWYVSQLILWQIGYMNWTGLGARAGEDLIQYPMPAPQAAMKADSLITGRHVDSEQNPLLPAQDAVDYLLSQGVQREVVGHTPIGHSAVIVRNGAQNFESIFGDISRSPDQTKSTWVRFVGPDYQKTVVEGMVLIEGRGWEKIRAVTQLGRTTPVGQLTASGARVIGKDGAGRWISTRMDKFVVTNRDDEDCSAWLEGRGL